MLPPDEQQLKNESLQLWGDVTKAIHAKQFSKATSIKQVLEESQREKARERERTGTTWSPVYFTQVTGNGGKPELSEKGRQVLERAQKGDWSMDGIVEDEAEAKEEAEEETEAVSDDATEEVA